MLSHGLNLWTLLLRAFCIFGVDYVVLLKCLLADFTKRPGEEASFLFL